MKKILVTGASGLIGSAVIPFLKDGGFEVYALSTRLSGKKDGVAWIRGNLFDSAAVEAVLREIRPEFLLHLAWQSTGNFDDNSNYEFLTASVNLLRLFADCGGRRVVMAGTYAEYGYRDGIMKESQPAEPINAYSQCKAFLCSVAQDFCSRNGMSFGWARIFSVYGRERDARRLTADVVNHLMAGEKVTIRSGSLVRDYIYLKDAAEALTRFLESDVEGVVNICTGRGTSIHDYVTALARAMGREELAVFEERSSRQQAVVIGDDTRLREEVGFTPRWTMEKAVRDIVKEYEKQETPEVVHTGLVSVLLSIYDVEEYLEECLDSLLGQSYANLEIVCVNNGSPDGCAAILERYAAADERIKIVTVRENRKLCGGRNAGLDNATGEYVCFVDPDDRVEKDYIGSMVEAIENARDPEGNAYNLVVNYNFKNYMIKDGQVKILYEENHPGGDIDLSRINNDVTLETNVPMWGRLYRASFLKKYNIRFLDGFQTDNIPYTQKLLAHMGRFYAINRNEHPDSCYWRRMQTDDGVLTATVLFRNMEIPECLEDLYDYLKTNGLEGRLKVMFWIFFTICFPRHEDMPGYYLRFRKLAQKMEKDIKTLDVYNQADRNLCNLLIYSGDFFQFCDLYFRNSSMEPEEQTHRVKLFGKITLYKKKAFIGRKAYYYFFGIPMLKTRKTSRGRTMVYLFHFLPLFSVS